MSSKPNCKNFTLRLPQAMSAWLTENAAKRFQSQNAMIIEILRKEMDKGERESE